MTVNANFWTTHREWMAREGPQHLVLGQEHRLEAARCDDESGKLEREGWRCGFTSAKRNAVRVKSESAMATSAGTFVAAPKHWGLGMGVADARLADQGDVSAPGKDRHGVDPYLEGAHCLQCLLLSLRRMDRAQPAAAGVAR